MRFKEQIVELQHINVADTTFQISSDAINLDIENSIKLLGLINPPILLTQGDYYTVISGFRRISACRNLGWDSIPARLLDGKAFKTECAYLAITENVTQRPLNLLEQARAIELLANTVAAKEVERLAKAAGLKVNCDLIGKLLIVAALPPELQQGLSSETLALPIVLRLDAMTDIQDAKCLGLLLIELGLSLNRQRKIIDWVEAIAHRDGMTIMQVLTEKEIVRLRQDSQLDQQQKVNLIWYYLRKRRYPAISKYEQRFNATLKQLHLKKGMQISEPSHFEGRTYTLRIDFQNIEELHSHLQEIERVSNSPLLHQLLEPFDQE